MFCQYYMLLHCIWWESMRNLAATISWWNKFCSIVGPICSVLNKAHHEMLFHPASFHKNKVHFRSFLFCLFLFQNVLFPEKCPWNTGIGKYSLHRWTACLPADKFNIFACSADWKTLGYISNSLEVMSWKSLQHCSNCCIFSAIRNKLDNFSQVPS